MTLQELGSWENLRLGDEVTQDRERSQGQEGQQRILADSRVDWNQSPTSTSKLVFKDERKERPRIHGSGPQNLV